MTYSDYKSQHTIKVICSITPDSYISFVLRAYSGSFSDNAITLKWGILDMCEPGDCLLADKGFTVSNTELQPRGLTLNPYCSSIPSWWCTIQAWWSAADPWNCWISHHSRELYLTTNVLQAFEEQTPYQQSARSLWPCDSCCYSSKLHGSSK